MVANAYMIKQELAADTLQLMKKGLVQKNHDSLGDKFVHVAGEIEEAMPNHQINAGCNG